MMLRRMMLNPKLEESTAETEIDDVWCSPAKPRSKKFAKRGIADEHDHLRIHLRSDIVVVASWSANCWPVRDRASFGKVAPHLGPSKSFWLRIWAQTRRGAFATLKTPCQPSVQVAKRKQLRGSVPRRSGDSPFLRPASRILFNFARTVILNERMKVTVI